MTIYTEGSIGAEQPTLEDFPSSTGESLSAAAQAAWEGNPSVVVKDAANLYEANTGKSLAPSPSHVALFGLPGAAYDFYKTLQAPDTTQKVERTAAEQQIKDAGVDLKIPDSGYSQAALDILIKRKRDNMALQDAMARAPGGVVNSSARFLAQIAASLADPTNIAISFIPVVGEAKYAEMLANASGAFGRTVVRAGVGAAEGAAGSALIEPVIYGGRTQLQDDYSMADSLENIAFGGVFGGGLHAVGGGLAESIRSARGLPQSWGRTAANESSIAAANGNAALSGTMPPSEPAPRRLSDEALAISQQIDRGAYTAEQFGKLYDENPALAKEIVAFRTGDRPSIEPAPFYRAISIESARAQAIKELSPEIRAQLTADAGNLADKGVIADLKAQQLVTQAELDRLREQPQVVFKETAKDLQSTGLTRKEAESKARQQLADREAELNAKKEAIGQQIETNAKAQQAAQAIAQLDRGGIPDQFIQQVDARAQQIIGKANLREAIALPPEISARFAVSNADPELRRAALSAAVTQAAQGKLPDVNDIIQMKTADPKTVNNLSEMAQRAARPEASATSDFSAADSAIQRYKTLPKDANYQAAESEMTKAIDRLMESQKNLEQSGLKSIDIDAELKPFDDAIKTADEYGNALRAAALCGIRS